MVDHVHAAENTLNFEHQFGDRLSSHAERVLAKHVSMNVTQQTCQVNLPLSIASEIQAVWPPGNTKNLLSSPDIQ